MFYGGDTNFLGEDDSRESGFGSMHDSFGGDDGDSQRFGHFDQRDLERDDLGHLENEMIEEEHGVTRVITDADGNTVEISNSQRKYTNVAQAKGPAAKEYYEIFCGRIPKEVLENELVPLFEFYGRVVDLRLMMNPVTKRSRGFAFVKFTHRQDALKAVESVNGYEVRPGKPLSVSICRPKLRLFVGNIPKLKGKEELYTEFDKRTYGLKDVIIYNNPDDTKKNRGFCFLEYGSHRDASMAKKRLSNPPMKIWGCDILVDWADPVEEPDEDIMQKVKVLYVRNIPGCVTEADLKAAFGEHGTIDRVKKIKDYAFIHFHERQEAAAAKSALDRREFGGSPIEVTWAKPPTDKQKRQEILRAREKRMLQLFATRPVKASENTAVTQMGMYLEEPAVRHAQGMGPPQGQGHGSGDNEYQQQYEDFEDHDFGSDFDYHRQQGGNGYPARGYGMNYGPPAYPSFFPGPFLGPGMGHNTYMEPEQAPRRQTLAEALRLQEEGHAGGHFSGSVSQPRFGTILEEEEPLPGFPIFHPRPASVPMADGIHGSRRPPQRQRARGGERARRPATAKAPGPVPPSTADENWRANCGLNPAAPRPKRAQQWTSSSHRAPAREPGVATSETGTNTTTPSPPSLSPRNSAPNVSWRARP